MVENPEECSSLTDSVASSANYTKTNVRGNILAVFLAAIQILRNKRSFRFINFHRMTH